ncbi:SLC13 family permease [Eggerthella sinensis]|uniref:Sodium:sulfate symporter n=1 Tax=Eggerthella sinensis TaxID=242230 RepID=A0A3N0IT10_9ACTN|nr:SLC13 family permease [Eggerthella sinensis]RDB62903.1 hypothetical protein C1876_17025 [Eggerthella sinensis]RNM40134.1 hypothetical protein DMP09_15700 [Eggerthella sinensis]
MKGKTIKLVIFALVSLACVALGWFIAPLEGLDPGGMRFLAIFIWWVVMLVLELTPLHITSLIACVLCIATGVPDAGAIVFSQLGSPTVLLMLGAFGLAAALAASGLLKRIALRVVRLAPKTGLAQLLSFEAAAALITPWIPAAVGKQAILVPLGEQIAGQLGFKPHGRARTSFFLIVLFFTIPVGACFLTGYASVATALAFIPYEISWVGWLRGSAVYLVTLIVLLTAFIVFYFRSSKEDAVDDIDADAITRAVDEQLAQMGRMSKKEWFSLAVMVGAVALFLMGDQIGVPAYIVALGAWLLLAVGNLFTTQDFMVKLNWPILIFIGTTLGLIGLLQATGVAAWIASLTAPMLAPFMSNPFLFVAALVILVYLLRFAMVGPTVITALAAAMFASSGVDPFVYVFVILVSGIVFLLYYQNPTVVAAMGLTGGNVVQKDITTGAVAFMVANLAALLISVPYWMVLGMI